MLTQEAKIQFHYKFLSLKKTNLINHKQPAVIMMPGVLSRLYFNTRVNQFNRSPASIKNKLLD